MCVQQHRAIPTTIKASLQGHESGLHYNAWPSIASNSAIVSCTTSLRLQRYSRRRKTARRWTTFPQLLSACWPEAETRNAHRTRGNCRRSRGSILSWLFAIIRHGMSSLCPVVAIILLLLLLLVLVVVLMVATTKTIMMATKMPSQVTERQGRGDLYERCNYIHVYYTWAVIENLHRWLRPCMHCMAWFSS